MFSVPDHLENTHHRGHNSNRQLCRCATCNRNCTYTKLRIINRSCRLDSTLSVFVIICTIHTLSWCQIVVRIKLLPRPYEQDFAVNFYSDPNSHIHTSISRGISRGFEIFRLLLRPFATAYWRHKKRVYFLWT